MSDETSIQKPEAEAAAASKVNNEDDPEFLPAADEKKTPVSPQICTCIIVYIST